MHPVIHPVVGYVCYAVWTRLTGGDRPGDDAALVAIGAATIPDLVDQPLWLLGVTPVGRTVAHSVLVAIPTIAIVGTVARRRGRPDLGVAFAIGYLSHLAADTPWHLLAGDVAELGFLLWPITHMPPYTGTKPLGTVGGVEVTTRWLEVIILTLGVALWWGDGRPGLGRLRRNG